MAIFKPAVCCSLMFAVAATVVAHCAVVISQQLLLLLAISWNHCFLPWLILLFLLSSPVACLLKAQAQTDTTSTSVCCHFAITANYVFILKLPFKDFFFLPCHH